VFPDADACTPWFVAVAVLAPVEMFPIEEFPPLAVEEDAPPYAVELEEPPAPPCPPPPPVAVTGPVEALDVPPVTFPTVATEWPPDALEFPPVADERDPEVAPAEAFASDDVWELTPTPTVTFCSTSTGWVGGGVGFGGGLCPPVANADEAANAKTVATRIFFPISSYSFLRYPESLRAAGCPQASGDEKGLSSCSLEPPGLLTSFQIHYNKNTKKSQCPVTIPIRL
jgi:hypothetical protein